jgi:hypothetical protein
VPEPQRLRYARHRPPRGVDLVQRLYVAAVGLNTAVHIGCHTIRLVTDRSSIEGSSSTLAGQLLEYSWTGYAILLLGGLLLMLAQRRQNRWWVFSLCVVFCGLMVCIGMFADIMSH